MKKINTKNSVCTILVIFFFITTSLFGQTLVSGIINNNTTWTQANSPYLVTGNTMITETATLNVEPGVVVKFSSNVQLLLRGKLFCRGTVSDTIKFIANNGVTGWNGIRVDNSSSSYNPKVKLKYFKAKKAATLFDVVSMTNGIDTLIKLTHCVFDSISSVINQDNDVKSYIVYIDSCSFSRISYYVNIGASNNIIKNSKIHGNYRAFYNNTSQGTIIDNCEFSGFSDNAILVNGIITNSNFFNNKVAICTMNLNYTIIKYNYIHDNVTGIDINNYQGNTSLNKINFNKICNNTNGVRNTDNTFYKDAYVPYNCWCLTDSSQIQSVVYDFFDAGGRGFVFYMPFDTSCTYSGIGLGLNNTVKSEFLNVNVYPNPFNNEFSININFEMPTTVDISFSDILGRRLFNIYKGVVNSGNQNIKYNSMELERGIYFIVIKSGTETVTKKVIKY